MKIKYLIKFFVFSLGLNYLANAADEITTSNQPKLNSSGVYFQTSRQYEEYFENSIRRNETFNFSEMQVQVRDYFRALVSEDITKTRASSVIAEATKHSIETVNGYIYSSGFTIICSSLSGYMKRSDYKRLSEILEELNERSMPPRPPSPLERLMAWLSGYTSLPAHVGGDSTAAHHAPPVTVPPKTVKVS
jgi:hypothetical protein